MNNAAKFSLGSSVTLSPFFFPSFENNIFEVVDSRIQNGIYTFTVAKVDGGPSAMWQRISGIMVSDISKVVCK